MSQLVTLSRPHPTVWQLTLNSPPDNRLTPDLLNCLGGHLDTIEAEWRRASGKRDQSGPMSDPNTFGEHKGAGAVILTGQDKFFSNGLDYAKAMSNKRFFEGEWGGYYVRNTLVRSASNGCRWMYCIEGRSRPQLAEGRVSPTH